MNAVWLMVGAGWSLVAFLLGLVLGASIRLADEIDAATSNYGVEVREDVAS